MASSAIRPSNSFSAFYSALKSSDFIFSPRDGLSELARAHDNGIKQTVKTKVKAFKLGVSMVCDFVKEGSGAHYNSQERQGIRYAIFPITAVMPFLNGFSR